MGRKQLETTQFDIRWPVVCLAALAVAALSACGETVTEPEAQATVSDDQIEQALEGIADELGLGDDGSLGSLDDADEVPAFGRAELAEMTDEEVGGDELSGDLRDDPELADRIERDDVRLFSVLALWGRIRQTDAEPRAIVWNPTLSVMEGDGIRVRRTVHFDLHDEVLPQTERNRVSFISQTMPHVDGVILQIAVTAEGAEDAYLRFRSEPLSVQIPATSLPGLNEFHLIDDAGNGLMLVAVDRPIDRPCPGGFLAGRWVHNRDNGGVFGGAWTSEDGRFQGHLAGRFGVTEDGRHLFGGKIIDDAGRFMGIAHGQYGEGSFQGEWYARGGEADGVLRGHYVTGDEAGHGRFRGMWRLDCRPDDGEPTDPELCRDGEGGVVRCPTDERPTDERPTDERPSDGTTDGRPSDGTTDERPSDGS